VNIDGPGFDPINPFDPRPIDPLSTVFAIVIIRYHKHSILRETIPCKYQHSKTEINTSQGCVATHLRCGGIFIDHTIANLLLSMR